MTTSLDRQPLPANPTQSIGPLSNREAQILKLITWGYANKEIADLFNLSVKTVEAHKANGMRKMGFTSRKELVRYAVAQDWFGELRQK